MATATAEEAARDAETAEAVEMAETADMAVDDTVTDDEAILEMVALEMAAPDVSDADDYSDYAIDEVEVHVLASGSIEEIEVAIEPPPAEPVIMAQRPEPAATPALPPLLQPSLETSLQPAPQPSQPSPQPLARLGIDRQRHCPQAERRGLRPAGADPAHEPGRKRSRFFS